MFSDKPDTLRRIDLNADVGEEEGADGDRSIVPVITSANIACGFHAGSPAVIARTIEMALAHGVAIGAHPSFDDRAGFGRIERHLSARELENLVAYQVGALAAVAALQGARVRHVKPHGALFNMAARDASMADAVARAVKAVDAGLILFGPPGSELTAAGTRTGLATAGEAFADRAYRDDGSLVPRSEPGAVLAGPDEVVAQAMSIALTREVTSVTGNAVRLNADTLCVHGDTPGAALLAARIRHSLTAAGVVIQAIGT